MGTKGKAGSAGGLSPRALGQETGAAVQGEVEGKVAAAWSMMSPVARAEFKKSVKNVESLSPEEAQKFAGLGGKGLVKINPGMSTPATALTIAHESVHAGGVKTEFGATTAGLREAERMFWVAKRNNDQGVMSDVLWHARGEVAYRRKNYKKDGKSPAKDDLLKKFERNGFAGSKKAAQYILGG